uniref:Uncharacterized protein n=1 Tax=Pithovirus LCDPAC02 TaxID=2506601 RepID=A0A481YQJ5_9VIRU|nr:MAG: hypothetical protein LCDPAC02_03860 [Pithovirus LCDPAC02]
MKNIFESEPEEPSKYIYLYDTFFIKNQIMFKVETFHNSNSDIKIRYDDCYKTVLDGYQISVEYIKNNIIKFKTSTIFTPLCATIMCINLNLEAPNESNTREWLQEVCNKFIDKIKNEGYSKWGKFKHDSLYNF